MNNLGPAPTEEIIVFGVQRPSYGSTPGILRNPFEAVGGGTTEEELIVLLSGCDG